MTRIEWSADGEALLAFASGHVRGLARDGRERFALPGELELRDARWRGEQVATIDRAHVLRVHRASGALDEERVQSRSYQRAPWASMSRGAARIASQEDGIVVRGETGAPILRFGRHEIVALHTDIPQRQDRWSRPEYELAGWLSDDGARLAIAFRSGGDVGDEPGSGWMVFEVDGGALVDRDWFAGVTSLALALDASGRRLAFAAPSPDGPIGVVAVGAGPLHAHPTYLTGADAVALDPHGALAAFGSPGRVRFDDLETGSTLALPLELDPIALAFSPDSRTLACLAHDGGVEIVPVP